MGESQRFPTDTNFLRGGGELGDITRNFNWTDTVLGSPERWPQSLKTTLGIILNSKFPQFLWWGDELIQFYNDAYRPSLGDNGKHPAVGQRGEECWPEIWPIIKPLIDQVLTQGLSTWSEDQLIPIFRNGRIEDVYWTFSYGPVNDESGMPKGVLVTCTETTEKVINRKRLEESEEQLRFAIAATELGTWDYNPSTGKFTGNARLKEWFGLSAESDVDLSKAIDVMAHKDRERVVKAIEKALDYTSGGFYDVEYTVINRTTGQERIVCAKGRAWFNKDNVAYRFNGTLEDITHEAIARKELVESELRFRSLVSASPVAICLFNGRDLIIENPNPAMIEIIGKGADIAGKSLSDVMPELLGENQPFLKILDSIFDSGQIFETSGMQVKILKNNVLTENYYDFTYTPLFDNDGKVYAILDVAIDSTSQAEAKLALQKSESNLRSTILQSPVAMCIFRGPTHVVEIANEKIMEIWGKTGDDVLNKPIFEGLPEAKGQGLEELLDTVYTTGEPFKAVERPVNLPRNGSLEIKYLDFVYEPLREANGKISGIIAVAIDITDKVVSRKKIEESELFAKTIIQNSEAAQVIWLGEEMVFSMVNERMLQILGRDDSILGMPFVKAIPELAETTLMERLLTVLHTGVSYTQPEEMFVINRYGVPYTGYYNFTYKPLVNAGGENYGIICTAFEVTDQVLARWEIEEATQKAKLAIASADLGTYEVDLITDEMTTDERFNKIWGVDKKISRNDFAAHIHPSDFLERLRAHEESLKTGTLRYEARIIHPDNSVHWVRVSGKISYDDKGSPVNLLGVIQDITTIKSFTDALNGLVQERTEELQAVNEELSATNEELSESNDLLVESNHALEQFNYAASHDLQEPLRKVQTFINLLRAKNEEALSETTQKYLQKIESSVSRLKTIIDDLLRYSHKTRRNELMELVDLNKILTTATADLEIIIQQKNAEIISASLPQLIAVPGQMQQLFQNLISNALKFSRSGVAPMIAVTCKMLTDEDIKMTKLKYGTSYVQIDFTDNGIGFEEEYYQDVFELFKRLHSKADYEGTGIGLSLCKKIVDNHKGAISVTSVVGKGSTFHVVLPALVN